ncbi:chloramphenicol acetyltransferase [Clostridium ihumii]|uniref:chloramphenicol acetyltransferase n=1 Tax=Clostridium ihumii TaxID=1470356 RepID=UPI0005549645|nr:chloramphenicol acetyltransferase [Clostridium ihumii]
MKELDLETWNRRKQFELYKNMDYPHVNVCANVDITKFYEYIKEKEKPFFISFVYVVSKVANEIKEFKYRIRGNSVVEHETVNPSFTIMGQDDVFNFCSTKFTYNFNEFVLNGLNEIEKKKNVVELEDDEVSDNCIFMTSIPWVSFTSMSHPIDMSPVDSIPRIAWGKYFKENGSLKMPLSVQAHHAVVDGIHIGRYFERIEEILNNPKDNL